jgi:hypothetical protein
MDNEKLSVKKFSQFILLGLLISIGLLILGFILAYEKQNPILQTVGWLFIAMGSVFVFILIQRKLRLLWIYKNIPPVSMYMKLEKVDDSDSTNYVAYLTQQENNISDRWKAQLYPPSYNVQQFLNTENQVQVYLDPKNNHPAVIRTTKGLLWVTAGSGAVQNLQKP